MAHKISITLRDTLENTLQRVENTITSKGGSFNGDTRQGQFAGTTPIGMVKGRYTVVNDSTIEITITDKPFLAPQAIIDDKIRTYFS